MSRVHPSSVLLAGLLLAAQPACTVAPPAGATLAPADRAGGYEAFHALVREWAAAVADDAVDRALGLYTPDARLKLDYLAQGPELRDAMAEWFPGVRSVVIGAADYDISGNLAYGVVRVLVVPADGGRRQAGIMTVIARWTTGRWLIRAQYLGVAPLA